VRLETEYSVKSLRKQAGLLRTYNERTLRIFVFIIAIEFFDE